MSNVIAIVNQKGGVGKTTSVYNIGYSLALMDKKVLMIDFDSQASLTVAVGLELEDTATINIGQVIIGKQTLEQVAMSLSSESNIVIDIVPSHNTIAEIVYTLNVNELIDGLQRIITKARDLYDYILIDCPPTVADMFIAALVVCDYIVAPVTSGDYLSYVSLQNTLQDLKDIQTDRGAEKPAFLGVILTRYKKQLANHKELYKVISADYRILGAVSDTDAFNSAIGLGVPVKAMRPATKQSRAAALEYQKIAEFIIQYTEYNNNDGKRKKQKIK
jgi:chromosome partitioning protein